MYQRVELIGNLGSDPEVRYTAGGTGVCTLSVATSDKRKDKTSGQLVEETEWHRVVLWDRLADLAGEYLKKGSRVFLAGRLKTRKWEKDGVTRYTTEVHCWEMKFLDRKGEDAAPQSGGFRETPAAKEGGFEDDDIPF